MCGFVTCPELLVLLGTFVGHGWSNSVALWGLGVPHWEEPPVPGVPHQTQHLSPNHYPWSKVMSPKCPHINH